MVTPFKIETNQFLKIGPVQSWFSVKYTRFGNPGNPDYLNVLKNLVKDVPEKQLQDAANQLKMVLEHDLPLLQTEIGETLDVVCVPRSKANMHDMQLLFRRTVSNVARDLPNLIDAGVAIIRMIDTRMTHVPIKKSAKWNHGDTPYPGITRDTCEIDPRVAGRTVLLVDDIYTPGVNIDEDSIQALYDAGAKKIYFYAIARTGG